MKYKKINNFESSTHMNYLNPYIALGGRNPFCACFFQKYNWKYHISAVLYSN